MQPLLIREVEHQNILHLQRVPRVQLHLLHERLRITTPRLTHRLRDQHPRIQAHLTAALRGLRRLIVRRVTAVLLRLLVQRQRTAHLLTVPQHIALQLEQVLLRTALQLIVVLLALLHRGKDHDVLQNDGQDAKQDAEQDVSQGA
jgi:hypothetical protein